MFQSTHPRGVRRLYALQLYRNRCFNPRTRVGCDVLAKLLICSIEGFNPRTRVGCDIPYQKALMSSGRFNPRTRVGCDNFVLFSLFGANVSIHAPAWGATKVKVKFINAEQFQSTHPRGVRLLDTQQTTLCLQVSIHAPAWGATPSPTQV